VVNENGQAEQLEGEVSRTFQGNFRIEIQTDWNTELEVIESEGGTLQIETIGHIKPINSSMVEYGGKTYTKEELDARMAAKPYAISKEITKSEVNENKYNLEMEFSNGLVFSYQDGEVIAIQNGKELNVQSRFLVSTPEGLLKLSFAPSKGEVWYVFDLL
jgi:hypothetical protein